MALKMLEAELKETPLESSKINIYLLNNALEKIREKEDITNALLEKIGKTNHNFRRNIINPYIEDGYVWFGALEYSLKGRKIGILFPWQEDRQIEIYTEKELSSEEIDNFIKEVASNFEDYLFSKRKFNYFAGSY